MKIALIGATLFVGSAIAKACIQMVSAMTSPEEVRTNYETEQLVLGSAGSTLLTLRNAQIPEVSQKLFF